MFPRPDRAEIHIQYVVVSQLIPLKTSQIHIETFVSFFQATQGTCLLSYSFSVECPDSQRRSYLLKAREAFEIGLLTKAEGELVTSKQELHTFLKTAYSLTVAHKWLGTPHGVVVQATQACQKAMAMFDDYCHADTKTRDVLCAVIMHLVTQVKSLLRVEPFRNSDKGSFIPDSYRTHKDTSVNFTLDVFSKVMQRFQKYHASLCQTTNSNCRGTKDEIDGAKLCITALGTTIGTLNTECTTEACKVAKDTPKDLCSTLESTGDLGSSWQNFSLSSSKSPQPSSSGYTGSCAVDHEANARNLSCVTTEVDDVRSNDVLQTTNKNIKQDFHHSGASSTTVPRLEKNVPSSSNGSSNSGKCELAQAGIETLDTADDWITDFAVVGEKQLVNDGGPQSLSQLTLKTSSSSLSNSFGSQSSWEKMSADLNSPTNRKPQLTRLSKAGIQQRSTSSDSDGSFFLLETLDSETSDSAYDPTNKPARLSSKPPLMESLKVNMEIDTDIDSVSAKPGIENTLEKPQPKLAQCASTEPSSESSFDMLDENPPAFEVPSTDQVNSPQKKNLLCYSCLKHTFLGGVDPQRQYLLSHQDYRTLLAGVCNECLQKRLHSNKTQFKLKDHRSAYSRFKVLCC